jgi:aspartate/tyrosine/aromatic aminotransferase
MATEVVGIKIQVDGKEQVLTSISDVKKLLKQSKEEAELLAAAGQEGSKKFQEASERVAKLKKLLKMEEKR